MASVAWCHERLDEMCARVQREAAAKADRLIAEMDDFRELTFREQRKTGLTHSPYSRYVNRRVLFPQMLAELDALTAA